MRITPKYTHFLATNTNCFQSLIVQPAINKSNLLFAILARKQKGFETFQKKHRLRSAYI